MLEVDQTMLMDMRYVNERRHFCCHVVHQVLMLYVPDMSSPSHVAPSLAATFDIDRRSRGNDGLDPMVRAGPCPHRSQRTYHGAECTVLMRMGFGRDPRTRTSTSCFS